MEESSVDIKASRAFPEIDFALCRQQYRRMAPKLQKLDSIDDIYYETD